MNYNFNDSNGLLVIFNVSVVTIIRRSYIDNRQQLSVDNRQSSIQLFTDQ